MLAALLGADATPALAAAVASRADGLPFAVEELAFALRDGGRLAYHAGTVTLTGDGAAPVPDGVREAVLLRTSRLTEPERALLEAAAAAGTEFDIDVAARAAAAAGTGGSGHWPDGFTAAGLLTEPSDGRADVPARARLGGRVRGHSLVAPPAAAPDARRRARRR